MITEDLEIYFWTNEYLDLDEERIKSIIKSARVIWRDEERIIKSLNLATIDIVEHILERN